MPKRRTSNHLKPLNTVSIRRACNTAWSIFSCTPSSTGNVALNGFTSKSHGLSSPLARACLSAASLLYNNQQYGNMSSPPPFLDIPKGEVSCRIIVLLQHNIASARHSSVSSVVNAICTTWAVRSVRSHSSPRISHCISVVT